MAKNSVSGLLTSVDSLFTTQEEREEAGRESVREIPLSEITDFPNHPFQVRMDEKMTEMTDSIRQYGVLVPAIVREKPEGGYEMVSGHRRKAACELAGTQSLPCIVRNLTDDEAILIMVDSNLQREQILPSEKAFAYKMKLEAMKRQGQRTDLTSVPLAQKLNSRAELGKTVGESQDQVRRFIRLTYLIPELLELVDNGKMALRPAVELSYLPEQEQRTLLETIECEECTPSFAQAMKLRKFSQEGKLNEDVILSIMQEEKPNQKEQFRMPKERISRFFAPGTPVQKMEDTIVKALEYYRKRQRDMER